MILSQCTTFCAGQIGALEIAVVRAVIVGPVMSPVTARLPVTVVSAIRSRLIAYAEVAPTAIIAIIVVNRIVLFKFF